PVPEDRDALEPPPEREARDLLRVVADEAEDVRVDHPRAADLDPTLLLAEPAAGALADEARHGSAERRLREREEVGYEARTHVLAEELAQQVSQRALEVGERDSLVDGESLDLVEDRIVRRIGCFTAVAAAVLDH